MYVDGYMLLAIYLIAVVALCISVYALWTLKEIEDYYKRKNSSRSTYDEWKSKPPITVARAKGHWD